MASAAGVTLDKVIVEIESNSSGVGENIDKLATSLEKLKSSIKGGFNNLQKLSDSLEKLKTSSQGLTTIANRLSKSGNTIATALKPLSKIGDMGGFSNAVNNIKKLPEVMASITPETLENVKRVSEELAESLKPLADRLKEISTGYATISKLAKNYNVNIKDASKTTSVTAQRTDILSTVFKTIGKTVNVVGNGLKKTFGLGSKVISSLRKPLTTATSKIKQMGMALLSVRSIFTLTRKAINEYMQMDSQLQDSIQNTWRAMGAQLAPVVEFVSDLFHQFVRVIYSIILALTGIDLIARANAKSMASMGNSAKKTLGNLQKFDDLNVVEFPSSGSGDDNKLIDMETIDLSPIQKIMDWVKELKATIEDALDTGKWGQVGVVFSKGINGAMSTFLGNFDTLEKRFKNLTNDISDFLNGAIGELNTGDLATSIGNVIKVFNNSFSDIFNNINTDTLGSKITDFFTKLDVTGIIDSLASVPISIITMLYNSLIKADWKIIGQKISEGMVAILKNINTLFDKIDLNKLGLKLNDLLSEIDWGKILSGLGETLGNIFGGFADLVMGLFGIDTSGWSDFAKILEGIGITVGVIGGAILVKALLDGKFSKKGNDLTKSVKSISDGFSSMMKGFGNAAMIISVLGGLALVISQISDLIKVFGESGKSAEEVGIVIGVAFGAIAIAFAALALAVKLLDPEKTIEIVAVLAALALTLSSVALLLTAFTDSGLKVGEVLGLIGGVLGIVVIAFAALAGVALLLGSNPLYLIAFAVIVAAICATLLVMAETLPIILEALGNFITTIAPELNKILNTIFNGVSKIVDVIGTTLYKVLIGIGDVFTSIFDGISKIISTVGGVIIGILNAVGNNVEKVLSSILNFIERLGPAINTFVDNVIEAITKMINFIVSGIEYLINTLIIDSINSLLRKADKIMDFFEFLGFEVDLSPINDVSIRRFVPALETGTNEIPYEGIYHLHPGEAVVPKKYNPALGNSNNATQEQMERLISAVDNISVTNVVNVGNETLYKGQARYNKTQQNKYGTITL